MDLFEYKVVPAPTKGRKARGVKRSEDKFALSVQDVMNEMAADGWEYQRSETLPHEERSGLTGKTTTFRSVLVFRRLNSAQDVDVVPHEESEATPERAADTPENTPPPPPKPPLKEASIEGVVGALSAQRPDQSADETRKPRNSKAAADALQEKIRPQKPRSASIPSPLRQRASQKRKQKGLAAE